MRCSETEVQGIIVVLKIQSVVLHFKERKMNLPIQVNQEELSEILLTVAPERPVFIWGAPGIGKSALVEKFAMDV